MSGIYNRVLSTFFILFFYIVSSCRLPQLTAAIELVNEISRQLNERKTEAVAEITSTFEELERALHQRKTALITDLENICSTKQKVRSVLRIHIYSTCTHAGALAFFGHSLSGAQTHTAILQANSRTSPATSHIPVNTLQPADLMIFTFPLFLSSSSCSFVSPFPLSSTYLSAGPASPAFISPPGEGTHPEQLQLYGAGSQPWECN